MIRVLTPVGLAVTGRWETSRALGQPGLTSCARLPGAPARLPGRSARLPGATRRAPQAGPALSLGRVVVTVIKELLDKVEKNPLPAEGISIEVQWTVQDENYLNWFTAVVVKRNVTQKQARQEKRLDRRAKCHQIQYTMPPNEIEWVLLEWAERPAKRRDWGQLRAGASIASKIRAENKAKEEAAEEEVPWRHQGPSR